MYNVQEIENEEEFDAIVLSAEDKLVAVDFSAEWCGPCKMIGPYFAQLSLQYTNVIFLKVDVDKVKPVAQKYGISAMPTFIFLKNQQKVYEFKGANTDQLNRAFQSLTGGVAQSTPAEPPKPASPYKYFPCTSYVYSDVSKLDMVIEKAIQFNDKVKETNSNFALSPTDIANLKKLGNVLKNVSMYHSSTISMEEYAVIEKLLLWEPSMRFPGLDILRLAITHPEAAKYYASTGMINTVLANLSEKEALYANVLMSLRFLVNTFKFLSFRQSLKQLLPKVMHAVLPHLRIDKKDGKVALATVFLNYSVFLTSEEEVTPKVTLDEIQLLVTPLLEILKGAASEEEEVNLRNITALGTILYGFSQYKSNYVSSVNLIPNSNSSKFQDAKQELNLLVTSQAPPPKITPSIPLKPANAPTPNNAPLPNPWSGFGNMPTMPGLPTPNPEMMQRLASNPELMAAMQNPTLMSKLREIMSDPSKISQYQNDPEVMQLLMKFNSMMQ